MSAAEQLWMSRVSFYLSNNKVSFTHCWEKQTSFIKTHNVCVKQRYCSHPLHCGWRTDSSSVTCCSVFDAWGGRVRLSEQHVLFGCFAGLVIQSVLWWSSRQLSHCSLEMKLLSMLRKLIIWFSVTRYLTLRPLGPFRTMSYCVTRRTSAQVCALQLHDMSCL